MLPNFIGIGAPKCGTTWLAKCLAEHPDVFMASAKETMFFASSYIPEKIKDEYEAHFSTVTNEKAVGEFSVDYFTDVHAPQRIKNHLSNPKLVVVLRNPIEQVYSFYWHLRRQNFAQWDANARWSFEEALEKIPELLLETSYYAKHLRYWFQYFPLEQFHIVLYDDICDSPRLVLKELFDFLEVDSGFTPQYILNRDASTRKGVSPKSPFMDKLHSILYEFLNQQIYMPLKRSFGVRKIAFLKDKLQVRLVLQKIFYQEGYPEMSQSEFRMLCKIIKPQVKELELLLNINLNRWLTYSYKL